MAMNCICADSSAPSMARACCAPRSAATSSWARSSVKSLPRICCARVPPRFSKRSDRTPVMPTPAALTGKTIWLTRPAGQGTELRAALERLGARVQQLPLLVIKPLAPSQADRQKLIDLDRYDLVFFVSTNAATLGLEAI